MTKQIGDADHRDFDETRRLLYMALLVPRTKRYNLAGTLVNALVHHHAVDNLSADEAADHVVDLLEDDWGGGKAIGVTAALRHPDAEWVREQIRRITDALGDAPGTS